MAGWPGRTRPLAAAPDRVYAALVDPEALVMWLPPEGMIDRFERFDARTGGSYRLVLTYTDASAGRGKTTPASDVIDGRFVELVPGVRIVQAVTFVSDDPTNAGTMTMTWELTRVEAGTRVEIRADNVPPGSPRRITPLDWPPRSPTSPHASRISPGHAVQPPGAPGSDPEQSPRWLP